MKKVALCGGRLGEKIFSLVSDKMINAEITPDKNRYYDIAVISPDSKTEINKFGLCILLSDIKGQNPPAFIMDKDVITCGMSSTDSVTLSSITENNATVCIQRRIRAFNNWILPCEYNVSFKTPSEPSAVLCAALLLIILKYPNDNSVMIEI